MEIRPRTRFLRQGSNELKSDSIDNNEYVFIKYSGKVSSLPNAFILPIKPGNCLELSCSFSKKLKTRTTKQLGACVSTKNKSIWKTPASNNLLAKNHYAKTSRCTHFTLHGTSGYLMSFQIKLRRWKYIEKSAPLYTWMFLTIQYKQLSSFMPCHPGHRVMCLVIRLPEGQRLPAAWARSEYLVLIGADRAVALGKQPAAHRNRRPPPDPADRTTTFPSAKPSPGPGCGLRGHPLPSGAGAARGQAAILPAPTPQAPPLPPGCPARHRETAVRQGPPSPTRPRATSAPASPRAGSPVGTSGRLSRPPLKGREVAALPPALPPRTCGGRPAGGCAGSMAARHRFPVRALTHSHTSAQSDAPARPARHRCAPRRCRRQRLPLTRRSSSPAPGEAAPSASASAPRPAPRSPSGGGERARCHLTERPRPRRGGLLTAEGCEGEPASARSPPRFPRHVRRDSQLQPRGPGGRGEVLRKGAVFGSRKRTAEEEGTDRSHSSARPASGRTRSFSGQATAETPSALCRSSSTSVCLPKRSRHCWKGTGSEPPFLPPGSEACLLPSPLLLPWAQVSRFR